MRTSAYISSSLTDEEAKVIKRQAELDRFNEVLSAIGHTPTVAEGASSQVSANPDGTDTNRRLRPVKLLLSTRSAEIAARQRRDHLIPPDDR